MKRRTRCALVALALLAGCGKKVALRPADGDMLPPKAATSALQPTPNDLLAPESQARPGRDNELVNRSLPLQPDRFDLPPPG